MKALKVFHNKTIRFGLKELIKTNARGEGNTTHLGEAVGMVFGKNTQTELELVCWITCKEPKPSIPAAAKSGSLQLPKFGCVDLAAPLSQSHVGVSF